MFQLFIDESGYVQKYRENIHHLPDNRYFVLGGIIVEDNNKQELENVIKGIIQEYFGHLELKKNFKLCYHDLRQCKKSLKTSMKGLRKAMKKNKMKDLDAKIKRMQEQREKMANEKEPEDEE